MVGVSSILSRSNITGLLFKLSEFVCPLSLNGISFDILFVPAVPGFSLRVLCINFLKLHYKEVLRIPNRLLFNQSFWSQTCWGLVKSLPILQQLLTIGIWKDPPEGLNSPYGFSHPSDHSIQADCEGV